MIRYHRSSAGLSLLFASAILCLSRADDSLSVGVAKRDITPKEPVPLWGYSSYHDKLSDGTLDSLYANVVVLQLAGKKLAIVSLDLGRPPAENSLANIRRRIKTSTGIQYSFITATHTHHGPVMELSDNPGKGKGRFDPVLRYYAQLEDSIVDAVVEASNSLHPARMAVAGTKLANFNYNRQTQFLPEPVDGDLSVLCFDDLSGKPIAILVNFAAHPTLVSETVLKFSADYPGVMKKNVEQKTGANVLFLQGAAGDLAAYGEDYESFGEKLATEVLTLSSSPKTNEVSHPDLQVKEQIFAFKSRVELDRPKVRSQLNKEFFPELIANYVDEYAYGVHPRLTVAVLNREIALVGVSGEFFCNHALRLRQRTRLEKLFFIGYCNGYDQYFPTIEAVAEGGYGADALEAPVAVGAGEQMMDTALIWIYQMQQTNSAAHF